MSAQERINSCHPVAVGAGCAMSAGSLPKCEGLYVVVDSACNRSILPYKFKKYAVGGCDHDREGGLSVDLAAKKKNMVVSAMQWVQIPVLDVDGNVRCIREKVSFSDDVRFPLLASMKRPMVLSVPNERERAQAVDENGYTFWFHVERLNQIEMPIARVVSNEHGRSYGLNCASPIAKKWILEDVRERRDMMAVDEKRELLLCLHRRLAHATGRRLYLTLKEKGWGGIFTEKQCSEVDCDVCRLMNRRSVKVPKVSDVLRKNVAPGEVAFHDLSDLPLAVGGYKKASVIVDARTRRVSVMALKHKDEAISHIIAYVRLIERKGERVKFVRSDNGGEFANHEYKRFLSREGIHWEPGAPYTPQSQGIVERANGVFKRLMRKTLQELRVPMSLWPGFIPGVVRAMNSVCHAVLGRSPLKDAGDKKADSLTEFAVGDVVSAINPKTRQAVEGYYGGEFSDQNASIVTHAQHGGWTFLRVHPSAVKMVAWTGRAAPLSMSDKGVRQMGGDSFDATGADYDYDVFDREVNDEVLIERIGEEEPEATSHTRESTKTGDDRTTREELVLAPGYGVVAENVHGERFVAHINKAYRRTLEAARLSKENGTWAPIELVSVKRANVVSSFPFTKGEYNVPSDVETQLFRKDVDSKVDDVGGEMDPDKVTREASQEQTVNVDSSGVEANEDVVVHVESGDDDLLSVDDSNDNGWFVDASKSDVGVDEGVPILEALAVACGIQAQLLPENKAKNQVNATKEDVAKGSHKESDMKELQSFFDLNVLGPRVRNINPHILHRTFTAGWRRTWKGEGNDRVAKSRLYAHGFQDTRDRGWMETYSGTADPGLMRVASIYGLSKGWRAAKVDVRTAFLQAESKGELYLRMPKDLPEGARRLGFEPGGVYPQLKAVYGRVDAARLFTQKCKGVARDQQWVEKFESILMHHEGGKDKSKPDVLKGVCDGGFDGVMQMHIDDLFCISAVPEKMLAAIGVELKIGDIESLKSDSSAIYTGFDFQWDSKQRVCEIGQDRYAAQIKTELSDKEKRKAFNAEDLKLSDEREVDMSFQEAQQAWGGILGWLAKTQPHLAVVSGEISRNCSRPSKQSVVSAMRACEYAKSTHKRLRLESVNDPILVVWVDASYNIRSCDGRLGWEIQVVDRRWLRDDKVAELPYSNVVMWRSQRCKRKLASTTGAELLALLEGIKKSPAYSKIILTLWGKEPPVVFVTDSQPLVSWLRKGWVDTDPHLQGSLDLVRERIQEYKAKVIWVSTKCQRADRQTKFIPVRF